MESHHFLFYIWLDDCRLDFLVEAVSPAVAVVVQRTQRMSDRCVKCHCSPRLSGDTWCSGCSAWEALGKELSSRWGGPAGLRVIADNLVLGAAREVRALRGIGAGLARAPASQGADSAAAPAGSGGAGSAAAAPKGLSAKSAAKPKEHSEESASYTYEYETEEETSPGQEETKGKEEGRRVDKRPASPERKRGNTPKRSVKEEEKGEDRRREERKESEADKKREKHREEKGKSKDKKRDKKREEKAEGRAEEEPKSGKKKKKKTKRGGRKHKRLHRLAEDPYTPLHRGLPERYLNERPSLEDRQDRRRRDDGR